MERLPNEIVEQILTNSVLSIVDVINFSSTSSKFREAVNSNKSLWETKYFQRWPKTDVDIICKDWYNECVTRTVFEKKVLELLSTMSSKLFHLDMKKIGPFHLDFTGSLINSHKYGYYYLRDFLIDLNSLPISQSLTNKYYGDLLMKHAHKNHCRKIWCNLLELSSKEQTLEKGAIFVTLWFQEYERGIWETVSSELDVTASKIKQNLLRNFPDHPLKNTPEEIQSQWKYKNITGNMFQPEDCKAIIYAMNYVLFDLWKYYVSCDICDNFNDLDKKRRGIDYALLDRKATPIIFAVIYESIARRLGVKIEVLEFLRLYLMRWKEDYSLEDSPVHYIRNSSGSIFIECLRCQGRSSNLAVIAPCTMQQIAQSAVLYIYPGEQREYNFSSRAALELVIKPFSFEFLEQLSISYRVHDVDSTELIQKLKDIRSKMPVAEWQRFGPLLLSVEFCQAFWKINYNAHSKQALVVHTRVEGINFAVGMIVRVKLRWDLTGVICGWDFGGVPKANQCIEHLSYKVLVSDGSYEYVNQKNLKILHSPPFISHPSIGRFFDEYCITYYKPNKQLQAEYPEDMEALQIILKKDRQN